MHSPKTWIPKYIVCPGWCESSNDGQEHWVSFAALVTLYGVSPNNCVMAYDGHQYFKRFPDAKILRPDPTGKYQV